MIWYDKIYVDLLYLFTAIGIPLVVRVYICIYIQIVYIGNKTTKFNLAFPWALVLCAEGLKLES